jgi:hypothetical protein
VIDDTLDEPTAEGCECPGEHECGATARSPEWFFTFGYGHSHPVTGESLAMHYTRVRMCERFDNKWAFVYPSAEAAGVERHGLVELPRSAWPPPKAREVVSDDAGGRILAVHELRAPCFVPDFELIGPGFMLRAVLVGGKPSVGDCAVYIGIGPAEWVAEHGNKLSFELARGFFPALEERVYRR